VQQRYFLKRNANKSHPAIDYLFGPEASDYIAYFENVWREQLTFHPYKELVLAHQNNGHPLFKNPF
jgi:monoamine oxidase